MMGKRDDLLYDESRAIRSCLRCTQEETADGRLRVSSCVEDEERVC